MPHLKGKEIPMFVDGESVESRVKVGTALVVYHDETSVEFYVRLEDPEYVAQLRRAPVTGLYFEISRPATLIDLDEEPVLPLKYPIHVVESDHVVDC